MIKYVKKKSLEKKKSNIFNKIYQKQKTGKEIHIFSCILSILNSLQHTITEFNLEKDLEIVRENYRISCESENETRPLQKNFLPVKSGASLYNVQDSLQKGRQGSSERPVNGLTSNKVSFENQNPTEAANRGRRPHNQKGTSGLE